MTVPQPTFTDIDASNFNAEVVERSKTMPVVVDFWATWCGPCKTLGPMLEDLALEQPGRFFLAKVDVDRNPELAQMFRVEQVPMVVGLRDGKLVDGFAGAQPLPYLRDFLDRLAPAAAPDGRLTAALELEQQGDTAGAIAALEALLAEESESVEVRFALARNLLAADRVAEATEVFAPVPVDETSPAELAAFASRLRLAAESGDLDELRQTVEAAPDDLAARIRLGRALVAKGRPEEGLDALLATVERDKDFDGQAARKAMLEAFEALGEEDPLVGDYRRRLQMLLF